MTQKQVQIRASLNKNTFCCIRRLAPFCIKTNPRENRFFAASGRLVGKKGTHNVKKQTENCTKQKRKRLFVGGVLGCKPIGAETGIGGEMVDVVFKHRGKGSRVCKPLYEMGAADALNSLTEVRCVLCRTHVYKKKSPSGMANHATGRGAWVTPYRRRISAERG